MTEPKRRPGTAFIKEVAAGTRLVVAQTSAGRSYVQIFVPGDDLPHVVLPWGEYHDHGNGWLRIIEAPPEKESLAAA